MDELVDKLVSATKASVECTVDDKSAGHLGEQYKKILNKTHILTVEELGRLVRDFQVDCYDGFVSNDHSYIELWLEKNIKKTPDEMTSKFGT